MRIVLLPSAYAPSVGGVEELTSRLAQHLTLAGDEVEVWTSQYPATLPEQEIIAGAHVRRFEFPLPRMHPADVVRLPMSAAAAWRRLREAAAETGPDVLHVQCFSSNGVYATALADRLRVPCVVSLQGEAIMDDHDVYEHSKVLRAGLRIGMRRASAVTGCSRFVLDDAERRFGLAPGIGRVIPNGVDIAESEPEVPLDLAFDRFVLGVGRVVEKKGFDLLLKAFARIAADRPGLGLVIGGDGVARGALRQLADDLGLGPHVMWPGTLSRGQVAWAMANASVFVLPSRVEPFGIVVLEALRAGCPAVVSSRGGASEVVRHQREGLIADPFDAEALAAAIGRVLDDRELRGRLSAGAVLRAHEFSWDKIVPQYRQLYSNAVESPCRPTTASDRGARRR